MDIAHLLAAAPYEDPRYSHDATQHKQSRRETAFGGIRHVCITLSRRTRPPRPHPQNRPRARGYVYASTLKAVGSSSLENREYLIRYSRLSEEELPMHSERLPDFPPPGKKRYKAICRDPRVNPFKPNGSSSKTQTVDVDADTPLSQVEKWAREAAKEAGLEFIKLEAVK